MVKKREVAKKNAAICKRKRRATRRYMRRRGTNMTLQSGDKEWLDGGKKRHAHALVWCTSVTQNRLRLLLCRRGGGSVEVPRLVGSSEKA
ncbi:hypothetical protein BS78_03G364200 [Paspalum vaginatum]|nr:hypothetical protein BS78_03G364200 [Paspalum vaginatum]